MVQTVAKLCGDIPPRGPPSPVASSVRSGSVMFADIVKSTSLLRALDPEDARDLLDAVLQVIRDGIHAYGGTVARVQGDGIMAVFGVTPAAEDHALRAAMAACHIRDQMQSGGSLGSPRPQIRIGVNSGVILLRWQDNDFGGMLDVVGHAAHVAAHVEQLCPPGSVAISSQTLELLTEACITRPLQSIPVEGENQPIEIFELGQVQLSRSDLLPVKGKTTHPLIGRDSEMVPLRGLVRAVASGALDGASRVVAIVGEPGMGKSRLLNETALLARQANLQFVAIRGSALIRELPFGCFRPAFHRLAGMLDEDISTLARSASLSQDEAALLASMLYENAPEMRPLPPDERNRLLKSTIAAVLRLAGRRVQVLLLVDDVQYLDIETLGLLGQFAREQFGPGLGLVMAGRLEAEADLAALPGEIVRLAPLASEASRSLADAIIGQDMPAGGIAERIVARAGGLPLAIEEFATLVATRSRQGAAAEDVAANGERLPARLESLFLHRIETLDREVLELCLKCCALGPAFPLDRLRRLHPMPASDLNRGIERLAERRILDVDLSGQVKFTHQLVQEAIYRTLSRRQRRDLHAELYAALLTDVEAVESEGPSRVSHAEFAHHAEAAGMFEDALRHLWTACEEAISIAAIETVYAIYRRAKAICAQMGSAGAAPAARFSLLSFDALQQLSLEQETRPDMLALSDGTVGLGPEVRTIAQINMALIEWINGSSRSARRFLATAQEGLRETESFPRQVYAELVSAYADYSLAEPRKALDRLDRLTTELRKQHAGVETFGAVVVIPHILALSFGAWYATDLGEQARASAWIAEATAISETLEHNYSRLLSHLAHGYFLYRSGRLDEAVAILSEGHTCCISQKFFGFEPASTSWLALSLIRNGATDEAARLLEDSIERGHYLRVKTSATYYHFEARCRLEMARGRRTEAIALADAALRHCRDNEELLHELHAQVLREEVLAQLEVQESRDRRAARAKLARRVEALGLVNLRKRTEALRGLPSIGAAA